MDSAVNIQQTLGVPSLLELLHPAVLAELRTADQLARDGDGLPDWEREEQLSGLVGPLMVCGITFGS